MNDWLTQTAADLGRGIEEGKIDPRDLTEAYLDAISFHEFKDHIYARLTEARARDEARVAADRAKRGLRRSPLDGVPISWKDLYDTAGVATESGTALLKGRVPDRDARVLTNATQAGLVCLGKTHLSEFAFSGLGLNPVTATSLCVNDHDAVSGGSSSGAATSVAFGLAAAAIGSDTAGSVRIPAAWNDLVGLKTVHGRLSLDGVVPLRPRFDTVGPLARTVEDASLLLSALEGGEPADLSGATLMGFRVGILKTGTFDNIEETPRTAFESAVQRIEAAGARLEPIEVPAINKAVALGPALFPAEAYATWRDLIERDGEKMYPPIRNRFLLGKTTLAADFIAGFRELERLRLVYREAVAGYDVIILPSVQSMPPKIDALLADEDYYTSANLLALHNTGIGNLMGLAAITVPTGVPSCGIMLQGTSEERLLRLAAATESALA